jgi:hypothetical protein
MSTDVDPDKLEYATSGDHDGIAALARPPQRPPHCDCKEPRFDRRRMPLNVLAEEWCFACQRPSEATVEQMRANTKAAIVERWIETVAAELRKVADRLRQALGPMTEAMANFARKCIAAGTSMETAQRMILQGFEAAAAWRLEVEPVWSGSLGRWVIGAPWSPWLWSPLVWKAPDGPFLTWEGVHVRAATCTSALTLNDESKPEFGPGGVAMCGERAVVVIGGKPRALPRLQTALEVAKCNATHLREITIVGTADEIRRLQHEVEMRAARSHPVAFAEAFGANVGNALRAQVDAEPQTIHEAGAALRSAAMLSGIDPEQAYVVAVTRSRRTTLSPSEAIEAERAAIEHRTNSVSAEWAQACIKATVGSFEHLEPFGVRIANIGDYLELALGGFKASFPVVDPEGRRHALDGLTRVLALQRTEAEQRDVKWAESIAAWVPREARSVVVAMLAEDEKSNPLLMGLVSAYLERRGCAAHGRRMTTPAGVAPNLTHVGSQDEFIRVADVVIRVNPEAAYELKNRGGPPRLLFRGTESVQAPAPEPPPWVLGVATTIGKHVRTLCVAGSREDYEALAHALPDRVITHLERWWEPGFEHPETRREAASMTAIAQLDLAQVEVFVDVTAAYFGKRKDWSRVRREPLATKAEARKVPDERREPNWFRVWCRYYADTEAFDRSVPHSMSERGEARPHDNIPSAKYAKARREELRLKGGRSSERDRALALTYEGHKTHAATDAELRAWGMLREPSPAGFITKDPTFAGKGLASDVCVIDHAPLTAADLPSPECTGIAASWCPIHGDCTCPRTEGGEPEVKTITDPTTLQGYRTEVQHDHECPLHCAATTHATTLHGGMNEVPKTFTSGTVKDKQGREWAGWVCGLDYGNGPDRTVISVFARDGEGQWFVVHSEALSPPIPAKAALDRTRIIMAEQMREAYEEDATAMMECRPSRSELIMDDEPVHTTIPAGTKLEPSQERRPKPASTEGIVAALGGQTLADHRRPTVGLPQPYAHVPGALDAFPVGQAPGEAEAFSRALATMAAPRVLRDPKPVVHDPGAALATMDRPKVRMPRAFETFPQHHLMVFGVDLSDDIDPLHIMKITLGGSR